MKGDNMTEYRLVSDLEITDKKTGYKTYRKNVIPDPYGIELKPSKSFPKMLRGIIKIQKLCEEYAVYTFENDTCGKVYRYYNLHFQEREDWIDKM